MNLPRWLFLVSLALFLPVLTNAQKFSPEMVALGVKLDNSFDRHMRGWKRERIGPGENVLIENWKRSDRGSQISIIPYPSNEAASNAFADFTSGRSPKTAANNIGNEAYQWGDSSNIVFRRGHFNVFIGSGVELTLLTVEYSHLQSLNKAEQAATSKLVACFVDLVILGAFEQPMLAALGSPCFEDLRRQGFINPDYLPRP